MQSGNNHAMTALSKKNKSKYICIAITLLMLALFAICLVGCNSTTQKRLADECVRIHIRANSNCDSDQSVKLKVRDKIVEYLEPRLEGCIDKQAALEVLCNEKESLTKIANAALYDNNFDYKARVEIKNEYFPDRQYDEYLFPEGNYDALIVYLGEGEGDNWWCVAFPPLCFVPSSDSGEKIVYKSWVKQWLDKLF